MRAFMTPAYTEPDQLRDFPADVRVYSYVLHLLERATESRDPARQYAAQLTLGTADRNLLPRAGDFVDPVTNALDDEQIRKYVTKTMSFKLLDAHVLTGPSLDAEEPGRRPLAECISRDPSPLLSAVDEGALSDVQTRDAEFAELRELAAEQERERVAAERGPQAVRAWTEAHPEFTSDDADILELRARGLDYWAIADALRPAASTDPAARTRARAWARARAARARPKLPAHVATHLPAPNRNGANVRGQSSDTRRHAPR